MSYYDAFWVATAAAAPVVTLAAVVAMPKVSAVGIEVMRRVDVVKEEYRDSPIDDRDADVQIRRSLKTLPR